MIRLFSRQIQKSLSRANISDDKQGEILRRLIAEKWLLQQTTLTKIPKWLDYFTSPVTPVSALTETLDSLQTGEEGTPHALTPQAIAFISELFRPDSRQNKAFYTPFEHGQLLAQKTLTAWLTQHAGLTYSQAEQWLTTGPDTQNSSLSRQLCQLKICDPAAGAGGLLIPMWLMLTHLAAQLDASKNENQLLLNFAQHNLYACDLSSQALTDLRLRAALTLQARGVTPPTHFMPHCIVANALAGQTQSVFEEKFPQVFLKKGGFNILLCNPPYMGQKNNRAIFEQLRRHPRWEKHFTPKSDLLYFFFHLALDILSPEGLAGFLTTAYWPQATSATSLRKRLAKESNLLELVNLEGTPIFSRATGQHNLITVFSRGPRGDFLCRLSNEKETVSLSQRQLYSGPHCGLQTQPLSADISAVLSKMADVPLRLAQVAQISNGLMTGCDKAFVLTSAEKKSLGATPAEQKKLKPFFKNSDISAYQTRRTPLYFLIDFFYPQDKNTNFSHYPNLLQHLAQFKDPLLARKQNNNGIDKQLAAGKYWFGSVRRKMNFEQEKLVVAHRSKTNAFAYAPGAWYASSDVYFITNPQGPFSLWYLLALFNSTPYYAWLYFKGKRKGNLLELYTQPLQQLPVAQSTRLQQEQLEKWAQEMYRQPSEKLQNKINALVANILGLTQKQQQALSAWIKQVKSA